MQEVTSKQTLFWAFDIYWNKPLVSIHNVYISMQITNLKIRHTAAVTVTFSKPQQTVINNLLRVWNQTVIDLKLNLDLHIYSDWCLSCAILICYLHFALCFTCLDILSIANEATCISPASQSSFPHDHRKQFSLKSTSLTLPNSLMRDREREKECELEKVVMTGRPAQSQQCWIYTCWNEYLIQTLLTKLYVKRK